MSRLASAEVWEVAVAPTAQLPREAAGSVALPAFSMNLPFAALVAHGLGLGVVGRRSGVWPFGVVVLWGVVARVEGMVGRRAGGWRARVA